MSASLPRFTVTIAAHESGGRRVPAQTVEMGAADGDWARALAVRDALTRAGVSTCLPLTHASLEHAAAERLER